MLTLLSHYNVRTRRPDETRDFYVDVLGLREGPLLGLHQIFIEDPNGITIELNFPGELLPDDAQAG